MSAIPDKLEHKVPAGPSYQRQALESPDELWLELELHKAELGAQNEQLVAARAELEESRSNYAELYDSTPVPYLVLDAEGAIRQANLASSELLGRSRESLGGQSLVSFAIGYDQ